MARRSYHRNINLYYVQKDDLYIVENNTSLELVHFQFNVITSNRGGAKIITKEVQNLKK